MTENTERTDVDDGFTIFRRTRTRTSAPKRERYTNKNRRNERMNLLHQVANGTMEPEVAARHLNRTYALPTQRFHHTVTRDGRINISGVVPGQSVTLMVDEWARLASYLGGKNFRRFIERNSSRLRTRRGPYTGAPTRTSVEEGTSTESDVKVLEEADDDEEEHEHTVVEDGGSTLSQTDLFELQSSGVSG